MSSKLSQLYYIHGYMMHSKSDDAQLGWLLLLSYHYPDSLITPMKEIS